MAVSIYLDSSGKPDNTFVTLATFAAIDDTWKKFENGWRDVLKSGPIPVDHMHMAPAVHKKLGSPWSRVKGWNDVLVWDLVMKLVRFINSFDRSNFLAFSCIVDMEAIRKLRCKGFAVPSEIFFCNKYVSEHLITAIGKAILRDHPGRDNITLPKENLAHFVFDMDEYFHTPFRNEWNREVDEAEKSGNFSYWQLVNSVTEDRMKDTPGIQAADMLAWGTNRENIANFGQYGTGLAYTLRAITAGASLDCNEAFIRNFLESENKRAQTVRPSDEYNPQNRSKNCESCDGTGEEN